MAMLRVSSYRRFFERSLNGGSSAHCAGQYQASVRAATTDECDCDKLDFPTAKMLSKEGLEQFFQERTTIAALNDRLVHLIKLARCFEEENSVLEHQVEELRGRLTGGRGCISSISTATPSDSSLDVAAIRLCKERDEILQDTEKLQVELDCLMKECEEAAQQRTLLWEEQQGIAEEVNAVTAQCLALREQVTIYEEQLATAATQYELEVKSQLVPAEWTRSPVSAIKFECPDMTPALDVKEHYSQLAESLQFECDAAVPELTGGSGGGGGRLHIDETVGRAKDVSEIKMLVSELQKELTELEKFSWELEDYVDIKKRAQTEEISRLEGTVDEMKRQEVNLREQMRKQCDDYKRLLAEKMARDMEIVAYRKWKDFAGLDMKSRGIVNQSILMLEWLPPGLEEDQGVDAENAVAVVTPKGTNGSQRQQ